jgi:hypothetical protein
MHTYTYAAKHGMHMSVKISTPHSVEKYTSKQAKLSRQCELCNTAHSKLASAAR